MLKSIRISILLLAGMSLYACGGGGADTGSQQPTGAVMHIMTSAWTTTIYGSSGIGGIGVTVAFPQGIAVKTAFGNVDGTAAVPSGAAQGNASVAAVYTAATSTMNGKLELVAASTTTNGFGTGEFITINFIISSGSPTAGSFTVTAFAPYDLSAQPISGMVVGSSVSIR
jgi:hypothetical protein